MGSFYSLFPLSFIASEEHRWVVWDFHRHLTKLLSFRWISDRPIDFNFQNYGFKIAMILLGHGTFVIQFFCARARHAEQGSFLLVISYVSGILRTRITDS
jgi:hypothetical protein